jgi:hypothetical protein
MGQLSRVIALLGTPALAQFTKLRGYRNVTKTENFVEISGVI